MKLKSLIKFKWLSFLILTPPLSQAFTVDSLIKFSNDQDYFLVTGNDENKREYINIVLSELVTHPGRSSQEINYTAENIAQWPIIAEPTEIIVDSREQVKVKIVKNYTASTEDRIFGITFTPDNLSQNEDKSYDLTFGYKTWYIIPGSKSITGSLDMTKLKNIGDYQIRNQTNKVVVVKLNYCDSILRSEKNCQGNLVVAPYTNKSISLGAKATHIEAKFHINGNKDPVKTMQL